jgi:hypothetical protein
MATFTLLHVLISLAGIGAGFIVLYGLIAGKRLDGWTAIFLVTTVLTSLTGFLFPFKHLQQSHIVGVISQLVLAVAIFGRYVRNLVGAWRWIYVVGAVLSLYLNVFVAIVQAFLKVPALKAMAPHQTEPPFVLAQVVAMAVFVILGIIAVRKFHAEPVRSVYRSGATQS